MPHTGKSSIKNLFSVHFQLERLALKPVKVRRHIPFGL